MRRLPQLVVFLMSLGLLLTSVGQHGFYAGLSHDLDHREHLPVQALDHVHESGYASEGNAATAMDEIAHQLLHAGAIMHMATGFPDTFSWDAPTRGAAPFSFHGRLTLALLDSPFRPPRSPSSL